MAVALKKKGRTKSAEVFTVSLSTQPRDITEREREVVRLVAAGLRNREIAEHLHISVKTVETHRSNIMNKLAFRNAAQLIHYAIKKGLISIEME